MIIRKATAEDIPAIVQLLKASLGEVSSKKSIEYWNWKHVNNPFGASPVLVAEEANELIGVRALMCWNWREGEHTYHTLRAVDTATHPNHQGKGIFKKLTLQLIEQAKQENYAFIFNSPNKQSTPGYLKMGWEVWGKMPLWIKPVFALVKYRPEVFEQYHQKLAGANMSMLTFKNDYGNGMRTVVTPAFLKWRYQQCPVKEYGLEVNEREGNFLWLFFTVKQSRIGMELRICQFIFSRQQNISQLVSTGKQLAKKLGCRFVSFSGLNNYTSYNRLKYGCFSIRKFSVTLTIRLLADAELYNSLHNKKNWLLQSGDIELF